MDDFGFWAKLLGLSPCINPDGSFLGVLGGWICRFFYSHPVNYHDGCVLAEDGLIAHDNIHTPVSICSCFHICNRSVAAGNARCLQLCSWLDDDFLYNFFFPACLLIAMARIG